MEQTKTEDILNLGTCLGRKQAFGLVARRCSAAEIECLIEARENKLYLAVEPTWEAYCQNRAGISRSTADRLIHRYQEQGPSLARLNSYTRIRPSEYRLFAGALTGEGLAITAKSSPSDWRRTPTRSRRQRHPRPVAHTTPTRRTGFRQSRQGPRSRLCGILAPPYHEPRRRKPPPPRHRPRSRPRPTRHPPHLHRPVVREDFHS